MSKRTTTPLVRPIGGHPSSEIRTDDEDDYLDDVAEEEQDENFEEAQVNVGNPIENSEESTKPRKKLSLKAPKPRAKLDFTRYARLPESWVEYGDQ